MEVILAIAEAKRKIEPLKKKTQKQRGLDGTIKYAYISIDEICDKIQKLFGELCVVIVPETSISEKEQSIVMRNGNEWQYIKLTVAYKVYGKDGKYIEASTIGEALDNADKGYNKAQTSAYKNLLLRLLDIGDSQEDSDNDNHAEQAPFASSEEIETLKALIKLKKRSEEGTLKAFKVESFEKITKPLLEKMIKALNAIEVKNAVA